jgi:hypothetical protein
MISVESAPLIVLLGMSETVSQALVPQQQLLLLMKSKLKVP